MLKDFTAYQLSKEFYQNCKKLRLAAYLKDQILRASSSIALNLAESNGNRTEKDRIRFFTNSLGSLRECQAILDLEQIDDPMLKNLSNQLGAILFKLCKINQKSTISLPPVPDSDSESLSPRSPDNRTSVSRLDK